MVLNILSRVAGFASTQKEYVEMASTAASVIVDRVIGGVPLVGGLLVFAKHVIAPVAGVLYPNNPIIKGFANHSIVVWTYALTAPRRGATAMALRPPVPRFPLGFYTPPRVYRPRPYFYYRRPRFLRTLPFVAR